MLYSNFLGLSQWVWPNEHTAMHKIESMDYTIWASDKSILMFNFQNCSRTDKTVSWTTVLEPRSFLNTGSGTISILELGG